MSREVDSYYENAQLPILFTLLVLAWGLIAIRITIFLSPSSFTGWNAYRGYSVVLIVASGAFCTTYVVLQLAMFLLRVKADRYSIRLVQSEFKSEARDPSSLTDAEAQELASTYESISNLALASRWILLLCLWIFKYALLIIFFEVREKLRPVQRGFLYLSGLFMVISLLVSLSFLTRDTSNAVWVGALMASPDDIRSGVVGAGHFIAFGENTEGFMAVTSMIADVSLCIIAIHIRGSFRILLKAIVGPVVMVLMTLLVSVARLVALIYGWRIPAEDFARLPWWVVFIHLTVELEAFFGTMLSCLPWMRLYIRKSMYTADLAAPTARAERERPLPPVSQPNPGKPPAAKTRADADADVEILRLSPIIYSSSKNSEQLGRRPSHAS